MALIRDHHLVRLAREVDIYIARELAADLAETEGFDAYQTADIETAVSELCSNALKYGKQGWALLRSDPSAFEAVITDEGPGFGAAPTTRVGLGVGLAGVGRLMDDIKIEKLPVGSRVSIRKERHAESGTAQAEWAVTIVKRPRLGQSVSGDDAWVDVRDGIAVFLAVDGLGSGERAGEAASTVVDSVASRGLDAPLEVILEEAHRAARETRGAVAMIVRIDGPTLEYAGVGDATARVDPEARVLNCQPGVLGVELPELVTRRETWSHDSRLTMWTDGLRPSQDELASGDEGTGWDEWAQRMVIDHGVDTDDALLLVAEERAGREGSP